MFIMYKLHRVIIYSHDCKHFIHSCICMCGRCECVCVYTHTRVGVRGQLAGVSSLPHVVSRDLTQFVRPGGNCFHPLSQSHQLKPNVV